MPFDPDTEIQYRKGGKIMKKTPRKFQAGGTAAPAPAPATKPAPKGGPKELQDEAERMRQEARDKEQQKAGQRRPNLGQVGLKKGGKVKKFSGLDGSMVDDAAVEREGAAYRQAEKDSAKELEGNTYGRFGDDTYTRAYNYANQLREPEGAEKPKKPAVRKAAPKAMPKAATPAPKSEPKAEPRATTPAPKAATLAPKAEPKAEPKAAVDKRGMYERGAGPILPPPTNLGMSYATEAERRRGERLDKEAKERIEARKNRTFASTPKEKDPYEGMSPSEKSMARGQSLKNSVRRMFGLPEEMKKGGKVAKYAKGGGIESKGKTAGKIVKMAKGGSVRGYGISKVTNKTKIV
jgi:hypothetical protein